MLYKSYLIEQNFSSLKSKITLFYGENTGLKKELKGLIKYNNKNKEIIKFIQDQIYSKYYSQQPKASVKGFIRLFCCL